MLRFFYREVLDRRLTADDLPRGRSEGEFYYDRDPVVFVNDAYPPVPPPYWSGASTDRS